jgi:pyridoxal 5'-phosphate synthase pdxS subunit
LHKPASLPVVLFTAGGIATPADAALMMSMGADGVFIGSGIFKSGNSSTARSGLRERRLHFGMIQRLLLMHHVDLGEAMVGINVADLPAHTALQIAVGNLPINEGWRLSSTR